jgi:hypothetical protein
MGHSRGEVTREPKGMGHGRLSPERSCAAWITPTNSPLLDPFQVQSELVLLSGCPVQWPLHVEGQGML